MDISIVSTDLALWNYIEKQPSSTLEYIGEIDQDILYEQRKAINNKEIKQFMFIHVDFNTVFNVKQVKQLEWEVGLLEKMGCVDQEILDVIKKGIKKVLDNTDKHLYLKIEYD